MPQETQLDGKPIEPSESRASLRKYDDRYFDPKYHGNIVFSDGCL